jgi:hypothetical protein
MGGKVIFRVDRSDLMGGRGLRIMLSSDQSELGDLRATLADAITRMGHEPVLFEKWGAAQASPQQASHDMVTECDFYIGIFDSNYSVATHDEYKFARERLKRIRLYFRAKPTGVRDPKLISLLEEVRATEKYDTFDSPVDLTAKVGIAISKSVAGELGKWPGTVEEILNRIGEEAFQSLGGSRLQEEAENGRLQLSVAGVIRYSEKVLVALDGPSLASVRQGMVFRLYEPNGDKSIQLGRIRVGTFNSNVGPLCEILKEESTSKFWSELVDSLDDEVLTKFPTDHFLTFDVPDRYLRPELHLQLFLSEIREKMKGGIL